MIDKMDISNKTLAVILVGAVVLSLAGTIMSLNQLGQISTTGLVTDTDTGDITLEIEQELSITTEDSALIDFGTCSTPPSGESEVINSEMSDSSICEGYDGTDYIAVRNDGNVDVNVTAEASDVGANHGGTFLEGSAEGSYLAYKTVDDGHESYEGGCTGLGADEYTNITAIDDPVPFCDELSYQGDSASVLMHVESIIHGDTAPQDDSVTFTFTAEEVI